MSNSNILKIGSLLSKFPNKSSKVELSQELKDKLVSVVSAYGKSNSDKDRDIIKDKTGKGNDFQILNADYKLNSSFGKYEVDFTTWLRSNRITDFDDKSFKFNTNESWVLLYHKSNVDKDTPSFKVHIDIEQKVGDLYYNYVDSNGVWKNIIIKSEEFETPISYNTLYTGETPVNVGFTTSGSLKGSVTQIPSFQGAFTTDGIDDLIMSQKSVSDMLDGSNEYTILSMIHHIDVKEGNRYSNVIRTKLNSWGSSNKITSSSNNKTGIYGYTVKDSNVTIINNILGDKNDYDIRFGNDTSNLEAKFSVVGWIGEDNILRENSSIAWYWTVIAKAVLTTDEINQVIAYYNLDRPGEIVKPDILYDVKRQGITNENHAEFNDELIDFSGNNYNLKLYNMLWDKQSGIGNYPISFKDYTYVSSRATVQVNKNSFTITSNSNTGNFLEVNTKNKTLPIYKVKVEGTNTITNGELSYRFNNTEGVISRMSIPKDGEYEIPESPSTVNSVYIGWCINGGINENLNIKITLLATDDITNAVVLDGVNNFGKVSNIPILKDYTVAAYRKWLENYQNSGSLISKSHIAGNGSFIIEQKNYNNIAATYSFGGRTEDLSNPNLDKQYFTYQSKYVYNRNNIEIGTGIDSTDMWIGKIRDNDSRYSKMAIWSLLLFPYSLSEFLLERQLKKYKLGTLYPNQVEFRPIVNSNLEYKSIQYINKADGTDMVVGQYYPSDTSIQILITPTQPNKVNKITINGKEPIFINNDNGVYKYEWNFDGKSPQQIKLKLGIDENLVLFNPIITANANYKIFYTALLPLTGDVWDKINIGDYVSIGRRAAIQISFDSEIDELVSAVSSQLGNVTFVKNSNNIGYTIFGDILKGQSPQKINITIDEYIRFEDIERPYPLYIAFTKKNGPVLTWGDKVKVGSIIKLRGVSYYFNNQICKVDYVYVNGGTEKYTIDQAFNLDIPVLKQGTGLKAETTWLIKQIPKFAYSGYNLNNIGLKYWGYLPDVTGQGNHLRLNNFAYNYDSGLGEYKLDFTTTYPSKLPNVSINATYFNGANNDSTNNMVVWKLLTGAGEVIPSYKITVWNLQKTMRYYYISESDPSQRTAFSITANGTYILPASRNDLYTGTSAYIGFAFDAEGSATIRQTADSDALIFDGVDDYGDIPTVTGVKSLLMKVEWYTNTSKGILYDQRGYPSEFAIFNGNYDITETNRIIAYQGRNNGLTYIDGYLNNNILASTLKNITHNIFITNELNAGANLEIPFIGCSKEKAFYTKMTMYRAIGFDDVVDEDTLKICNTWAEIEGNIFAFKPNITVETGAAINNMKIFQDGTEINPGYLFVNKDTEFELRISLNEGKYGLDSISVDGNEIFSDSEIDGYKVFKFTINGSSEQNIIVHSYEYIMYEDIPQPYPVLLTFHDGNFNNYTYGDKVKLNSIIKVRKGFNLFPDLYSINSYYLNGEKLGFDVLVTKDIVVTNDITLTTKKTYKLEGSAPKCIFSPEKLRIPNSSYRYLGYIPDISGNGNNGKINNSAYGGMSGANGYSELTFNNWRRAEAGRATFTISNDVKLNISKVIVAKGAILYASISNYTTNSIQKYKVTGVDENHPIIFGNDSPNDVLLKVTTDGEYKIDWKTYGKSPCIFTTWTGDCNITIEQIGEYEGAFCLDGIDDFVTIPTLSSGGKQVLMKVNWQSEIGRGCIYDQRKDIDIYEFAIFNLNTKNSGEIIPAYQSRNDGKTYIDGILNNNILVGNLQNIIHSITITNKLTNNVGTISPVIGKTVGNTYFMQMAFYDFMLFDEISTDEEIKQLNDIIGIEGNFVEWNPTITANISSTYAISPNIRKSDGTTVKLVKENIYSTSITGNLVLDIVPPNKDLDEVTNVIIDGKSYTPIKYQYADYYRVEIPLVFPQEINITIDEYIRYESIEQPYPIFLNYIDKETNKAYTWGDKVKVDSILKISGYKNLFENGDTSLGGSNGYSVNGSSELIALGTLLTSEILVNKINTGVKSSVIWNLDTPKPLFAYDPSIINNVGLKNLGYLPDITGQGRHLLLNEFAYEGMSGINGYPVVLDNQKTWNYLRPESNNWKYDLIPTSITIYKALNTSALLFTVIREASGTAKSVSIPSFKINVYGLQNGENIRYRYISRDNTSTYSDITITENGQHELPASVPLEVIDTTPSDIFIGFQVKLNDNINTDGLTIQILPNYEGALCFDGINDYGIVQNINSCIKSIFMKVNWNNALGKLLFDCRVSNDGFAINPISEGDTINNKIAYKSRGAKNTYIDGIKNEYIEAYSLQNITHNIFCTNNTISNSKIALGASNRSTADYFAQMAMYKVMGLPEIPSDEEIKTLNNWAGIEAKVELPSYYWDAYGKTNLDADRGYIKDQVSLQLNNDNTNDNSLENFNFGYDKMSGYEGYSFSSFNNTDDWGLSSASNDTVEIISRNDYSFTARRLEGTTYWRYRNVKSTGLTGNLIVKVISTKKMAVNWELKYRTAESPNNDITLALISSIFEANTETTITLPYKTQEELTALGATSHYYLMYFNPFYVPIGEEYTVTMLPLYPNGLIYDGISNYSENINIPPIIEDFTFLVKALLLKGFTGSGGCIAKKGAKDQVISGGYDFIYALDSSVTEINRNSYWSFGGSLTSSTGAIDPPLIGYMTKTSVNGIPIIAGNQPSIEGIIFSKWSSYISMVLYKSIFYTKTISLLEINFLKNLMEKDEIINLNNPIFIQK